MEVHSENRYNVHLIFSFFGSSLLDSSDDYGGIFPLLRHTREDVTNIVQATFLTGVSRLWVLLLVVFFLFFQVFKALFMPQATLSKSTSGLQ